MVSHYDRLVPLRYHTRELVLAIEVLLQGYYLSRKKATYSEAFYQLKRSYVTRSNDLKELTRGLVAASVFMEAVVPYLKERLEQKKTKAAKVLVRLISLLKFLWIFRYLVSDVRYFKPYMSLFGILVRYQNTYEAGQDQQKSLVWRVLTQYNIFFIYLFKVFCEWYFSSQNKKSVA